MCVCVPVWMECVLSVCVVYMCVWCECVYVVYVYGVSVWCVCVCVCVYMCGCSVFVWMSVREEGVCGEDSSLFCICKVVLVYNVMSLPTPSWLETQRC